MSLDALHEPDATQVADGIVMVRSRGQLHPLRLGGQPIRSFAPGWHAGALSHLLAPMLLLEFSAETGGHGLWLLDPAFNHLHPGLRGLSEAAHRRVALTLRPILDWLAGDHLADGQPAPIAAFLSLQPGLRREFEALCRVVPGLPDQAALDERRLDTPPAAAPAESTLLVHQLDDGAELAIGRTGLVVLQDDHPAKLGPGWQALQVCTLAFPTLILELRHEDGTDAVWYLDHTGRFLGPECGLLHPEARRALARAIKPLFDSLWQTLLLQGSTTLPAELDRLMALPEMIRMDLLSLVLDGRKEAGIAFPTALCVLERPLPRSLGYVVQTSTGRVALDPEHLRSGCLQSLQDSFIAQILDGETSWPSPVDGIRIRTTLQPLYLDALCFAYQLHDPRHDLTFHVVALDRHFRTVGIYVPGGDLFFVADAEAADRALGHCVDFAVLLLRHLTVYGASIMRGRSASGPLLLAVRGDPALPVGQYLRHDLAGLDALVSAVPPDRLPHCLVFDSQMQAEPSGPIDRIYPGLAGRVIRRRTPFETSIRTVYETGTRLIRITSMLVPRSIGLHVMAAIDRDPRWAADRADADGVPDGSPVILLGLRVGSRTIVDQAGFWVRLIADLTELFGDTSPVLVLDGRNTAQDPPAGAPLLEAEQAVVSVVAERCLELGIRLVDLTGESVARSLIWCRRAQMFVAPWGAALAKYRWICNTPGLVMTSHWNLIERGGLDIYHDPAVVEDASELVFVPPGHVEDVLAPGEPPDQASFVVDEAAAFALARQLAETCCLRSPA